MVASDFRNPRLVDLCDLTPSHPDHLALLSSSLRVRIVNVSSDLSGSSQRTVYILIPKKDEFHIYGWLLLIFYGWLLLIFEAITVVQVIRNSWGSSSLEDLVRQLVRHGIQFHTLVPASEVIPDDIIKSNEAPMDFTTIPAMASDNLTSADYRRYEELRECIVKSPHGRAAFRMGGILWRLAMESAENFDDIINKIMDGPCELGPTRGEYLYIEGLRYYDLCVSTEVVDTICRVHGFNTGQHGKIGHMFI